MIITIDGPAGTGKTTVAKRVAQGLHFSYFDTGAMYRSVTWAIIEKNISLSDLDSLQKLLEELSFHIKEVDHQKRYFALGKDLTEEIRTQKVTARVSEVAALKPVRDSLKVIQRAFAAHGDCVFEGRDMGTVVFPEADFKVFLTARPEVRAQRRLDELLSKMPEEARNLDHDKILQDLMRRDEIDSTRELAPLRCPEDALKIDTSDLSIDEVVEKILNNIKDKFPSRSV
jgi:CMP/dCMP kinase